MEVWLRNSGAGSHKRSSSELRKLCFWRGSHLCWCCKVELENEQRRRIWNEQTVVSGGLMSEVWRLSLAIMSWTLEWLGRADVYAYDSYAPRLRHYATKNSIWSGHHLQSFVDIEEISRSFFDGELHEGNEGDPCFSGAKSKRKWDPDILLFSI